MYVLYVRMYVCVCIRTYVCVYVRMYVCVCVWYTHVHANDDVRIGTSDSNMMFILNLMPLHSHAEYTHIHTYIILFTGVKFIYMCMYLVLCIGS